MLENSEAIYFIRSNFNLSSKIEEDSSSDNH